MKLRHLVTLNLLWLISLAAGAQTAEDFFNGGAQLYISNNIPAALKQTESGLKLYPNDVKLKKLEELLKQQQQSQNQQNRQNQQQNQQNQHNQQNRQNQSQQNQSQQNQQQQSQQSQQNQNSQAGNRQKQQQNPANQNQQQSPQQARQNAGQETNEMANAMTPADAKRLLDSQKDNEQFLQLTPKGNPPPDHPVLKDW